MPPGSAVFLQLIENVERVLFGKRAEPPAESVAAAETAADEAVRDLRNSKSLSRRVRAREAGPS